MNELAKMMEQFVSQGILTEEAVVVLTKEFDDAVQESASKIAKTEIEKETSILKTKLQEEAKSIASRDIAAQIEERANELLMTRLEKEIPALREVLTEEAKDEISSEFRNREITIVKEAENYISKTVEEQVTAIKTKLQEEAIEHKTLLEEQVMNTITSHIQNEIIPSVNKIIVEEEIVKAKQKIFEESKAKDEAIVQLTNITNNLSKIIEENRKETDSVYLRKIEKQKTIEEALNRQLEAERNLLSRKAELARDIIEEAIEWDVPSNISPELKQKKAIAKKTEIDKLNTSRIRRGMEAIPYPTKLIEILGISNDDEVSKTKTDKQMVNDIAKTFDALLKISKKQENREVDGFDLSAFKTISYEFTMAVEKIWDKIKQSDFLKTVNGYSAAELNQGPVISLILASPLADELITEYQMLKETYGDDVLDAVSEVADERLGKGTGSGGFRIKGISGKSEEELKAIKAAQTKEDDELDKLAYKMAKKSSWMDNYDAGYLNEESKDIKSSIDRQKAKMIKEAKRIELAKAKQEELRQKVAELQEEEKKKILAIAAEDNRRRSIIQEARSFFVEVKKSKLLEEQKLHEEKIAKAKEEARIKAEKQLKIDEAKQRRESIIEEARRDMAEQKRLKLVEEQRQAKLRREQEILKQRAIIEEQKRVKAIEEAKIKAKQEAEKKLVEESRKIELRRISIIEEAKQFFQSEKDKKVAEQKRLEEARKRDAIEKVNTFVEESVKGLSTDDSLKVKQQLKGKSFNEIKTSIRSIIRSVVEESTKSKVRSDIKAKGRGFVQESFRRQSVSKVIDNDDPYSAAGSLI